MLWHLLKYYMSFVILVFFKRNKIANKKYVQDKSPLILAMNHPNAFMDPVAFSSSLYPPRVRYLARGDAFKKGIVTWLLQSMGIIPIYRIQDAGKDGLKKNNETYSIVNKLLSKNKKIIIFAEGLCVQERRLRPLKKGVPRMIFGAMTEHELKDLKVVPIGINYTNPSQFRGSVFYNIGKPILMSQYMELYNESPAKTMNLFLADLAAKMKELIINIQYKRSEQLIEHLEVILKYDFFAKEKLDIKNLEHDFLFSSKLVDVINKAEDVCPEKVEELGEKTNRYFSELKTYKLKDWLINPSKQKHIHYGSVIFRILIIVLTFPIYCVGLIGNYIPYKLSYLITTRIVKTKEFKASFYMGFGALLFLINYIGIFLIPTLFYSGWLGLLMVLIFFMCGYVCLFLSPLRKKTAGMMRFLSLKTKHHHVISDMENQRAEIIKGYSNLI